MIGTVSAWLMKLPFVRAKSLFYEHYNQDRGYAIEWIEGRAFVMENAKWETRAPQAQDGLR